MQLINFFLSIVLGDVNISKINVKWKHQFSAHFENIFHKLPLYSLTFLPKTTYTYNHMACTI